MGGEGKLEVTSYLEAGVEVSPGAGAVEGCLDAQTAVIRFRDTGHGISPEVRQRLFLPFFTTKPGGSGIGLAIAKKIVESHRGTLDAEGEPGLGATFSVRLPHLPGEAEPNSEVVEP